MQFMHVLPCAAACIVRGSLTDLVVVGGEQEGTGSVCWQAGSDAWLCGLDSLVWSQGGLGSQHPGTQFAVRPAFAACLPLHPPMSSVAGVHDGAATAFDRAECSGRDAGT